MTAKDLDIVLMNTDFAIELLQIFFNYGLVDELTLRNAIIRKEYQESKASGERVQDFLIRTAEKYFISEKSVDHILYFSSKQKNNSKGVSGNGCTNKIPITDSSVQN